MGAGVAQVSYHKAPRPMGGAPLKLFWGVWCRRGVRDLMGRFRKVEGAPGLGTASRGRSSRFKTRFFFRWNQLENPERSMKEFLGSHGATPAAGTPEVGKWKLFLFAQID